METHWLTEIRQWDQQTDGQNIYRIDAHKIVCFLTFNKHKKCLKAKDVQTSLTHLSPFLIHLFPTHSPPPYAEKVGPVGPFSPPTHATLA